MLGRLIHQYSNIKRLDKGLTLQIQSIVEIRNALVHKLDVNRFSDQQLRAEFVKNSNIALKKLKVHSQQKHWSEGFTVPNIPRYIDSSCTRSLKPLRLIFRDLFNYLCRCWLYPFELLAYWILSSPLGFLFTYLISFILNITGHLVPSHSGSKIPIELEEQMQYHSWRMIKLDPHLQRAIVEDADGYFRGLFPQSMDEYLSKYPRVIHVPHQIMSMHSYRLVHSVFAISLLYFTLGIIYIFQQKMIPVAVYTVSFFLNRVNYVIMFNNYIFTILNQLNLENYDIG